MGILNLTLNNTRNTCNTRITRINCNTSINRSQHTQITRIIRNTRIIRKTHNTCNTRLIRNNRNSRNNHNSARTQHAVRDDLLTQSMVPLCVSTSVASVCDCRTHRLSRFLSADVDPKVCNGDWLCFSNGTRTPSSLPSVPKTAW
jgi:hypothetical protein